MKWYFALNASSIERDSTYVQCIDVAVLTALQHTNLHPHFIFDGPPCELTDRLSRLGVEIVFHRSSFSSDISSIKTKDESWKRIAHGAYLRVDLPLINKHDETILYTDCDVMFRSDPDFGTLRPTYFAVAPEFTIGDYDRMNSGVMLMNLQGMREVLHEFSEFIRGGMANFDAFDQGALRKFFMGRYEHLSEELNWKPYWGANEDAQIIHFHGPKPTHIDAMLRNMGDSFPSVLRDLFNTDPTYYAIVLEQWKSTLWRAGCLISA